MILQSDDWKFHVDMERTMEFSANEAREHCDCAYCQNFYEAVDIHYPELRQMLASFGLDIEGPQELLPYDFDGKMYYDSGYVVYGQILHIGKEPIFVNGLHIHPVSDMGAHDAIHISHDCSDPCFVLDIGTVVLPWVLDEPLEEVVSPANDPSFLKRMWKRLLAKMMKTDIQ